MLTRRSLLYAAAASPVGLPGLLGASRALADTPKNIVVMAKQIDDVINTFDPAEGYEITNLEVNANVYRCLVAPDPADNSKVAGDLAKSWTISPDGKTFTFTLKTDAKFPSGKVLTAEDVAFSLQRVVKLNKAPAFIITQFGYTKDNVDSLIAAKDPVTLVLTLPEPAAPSFVLFCLSSSTGAVVEKAAALAHEVGGDLGNAWLRTHSAGAGPYQLTEWVANDHIIVDENTQSGIPVGVRRIYLRHVSDPSAQLLLVQKGDADIARNPTPDLVSRVKADKVLPVVSSAQLISLYIAMNQSVPELAKPQVRQAIKWAIDYEAIAKNITPNLFEVAQGFLPPGLPGAMTDKPFRKDVAKAKALLAEAGLPDGFSVTMDFGTPPPYGDVAQAVQADLAAIGIKVTLLPAEMKQLFTRSRTRSHQLIMMPFGVDYFDANSSSQTFCENPDDTNDSKLRTQAWRSHYIDPELQVMSLAAAKERDDAKRTAMYREMQTKFADRAPFAFMLQKIASSILGKGVSGFALGPLPYLTSYATIRKV